MIEIIRVLTPSVGVRGTTSPAFIQHAIKSDVVNDLRAATCSGVVSGIIFLSVGTVSPAAKSTNVLS